MLHIRVLGPLDVTDADGNPRDVGGGKERAFLIRLLMSRDEAVPAGVIADALWGDDTPADPAANLQVYASRLRKRLGAEAIVSEAGGYRVPRASTVADVDHFEELGSGASQAIRNGRPEYAAKLAGEALALWRGDPYPEVRYESFAQVEIGRLDELRATALEDRIEAELALGAGRELIPELEALTSEHESRERLRGHLMVALYRAGRQADALAVFNDTSEHLGETLGIEPSPWLRDLEEKVLLQDPSLDATVTIETPHNLPEAVTQFVDRVEALEDITAAVGSGRAITIVGVGGMGKTRLAINAARQAAPSYDDGVWLVDVAEGAEVADLAQGALDRIGVDADHVGEPLDDLVLTLRNRTALLLLDGCDRAMSAATTVATALLRTCPGVTLLSTSREALRISGERVLTLEPLSIEEDPSPAEELFTDRARQAGVRDLPDDWSSRVQAICHRLDGIPLAIELVAGRLRAMSLDQIEARLDNVLRLAEGGARDADRRHQTLTAAIDWSFESLEGSEATVWTRLSVFPGRITLDAAEHVAGFGGMESFDVLDALATLVEKSMVRIVRDPAGGTSYDLLGTLRSYASGRIAEPDRHEANRRMTEFYLDLLDGLEDRLVDPDDRHVVEWIGSEIENLRAALAWALGNDAASQATQLAGALAIHWLRTESWTSGRSWLSRSLAASTGPGTATLASALALHRSIHGPVDALIGLADLAAAAAADDRAARLLGAAGALAEAVGEPAPEAGELASRLGDRLDARLSEGAVLVSR